MNYKFVLTSVLSFLILAMVTISTVGAQNDGKFELSLTPAVQELNIGESYEITILNDTDVPAVVLLTPVILYFPDTETRDTYNFVENETVKPEDYVAISQKEISVEANSSVQISAQYIKALPGFIPGVRISKIASDDSRLISTNPEIVSLILDYTFEDSDVLGLSTSLRSTLDVQILNIEVNNKFILTTEIFNDSKKIAKPTGEIEVFEGDIKIGNISLTQKINNTLLPGESIVLETEFTDVRGPWDRLGKITFRQRLAFDKQTLVDEISLFVFPYQVILYLIALVLILGFGIRIFLKRKEVITYRGEVLNKENKKTKDE